ncbi:9321_t:CDS:2 [Racocetra fulgida]|uniref:9321_t:CDS:1 n=1 Tax=Racocetra fulgida TaxID=60492 RepID=A0A9N8VHF4_9GLOM|nr:9321_t:CDS:2 [Racocetra fulgida]
MASENYFSEWEQICLEFFSNNDKDAEAVVGLVEFATCSNREVTVNIDSIDKNLRKEKIEELLAKIGFDNGVMLHPQEFDKYLETKRKVRSEFHRKKAIELFKELDKLLHSKPAKYTPLHRLSELETYLTQYKTSVGALPFIKGLLHVFKLQLHQSTLASWTFLDNTLTQNGIDFMRATVNLLVNVLGFVHTVQEADESGEQGSLRTWYIDNTLSDSEILTLIKKFPKETYLSNVRATGLIELSSQQRSPNLIKTSKGNIYEKFFIQPGREPDVYDLDQMGKELQTIIHDTQDNENWVHNFLNQPNLINDDPLSHNVAFEKIFNDANVQDKSWANEFQQQNDDESNKIVEQKSPVSNGDWASEFSTNTSEGDVKDLGELQRDYDRLHYG